MRRKNDEKIAENRFRFYFQFSTLYFSFRYRFSLLLRLFFDFNLSQFFNFFHQIADYMSLDFMEIGSLPLAVWGLGDGAEVAERNGNSSEC